MTEPPAVAEKRDFFISYTTRDERWAEWIAWQLRSEGYKIFLQAWHFQPGRNFVQAMDEGAKTCERTIAVLSPRYLTSSFTKPEWYAAFARDPTGEKRLLIPILIEDCDVEGLLGQIIYLNLVGLDEDSAREHLIARLKEGPAIPSKPPGFPGKPATATISAKPPFPGDVENDHVAGVNSVPLRVVSDPPEQAVERFASCELGSRPQDREIGHTLCVDFAAYFPDNPILDIRLRRVEVGVSAPRSIPIAGRLGNGKVYICESGVEVHCSGSIGNSIGWTLRPSGMDEVLTGHSAVPDDPLFELPDAKSGDQLTIRMVAFPTRDFFCGTNLSASLSKNKQKIIRALCIRVIGEPDDDGAITLCTSTAGVEQVPENMRPAREP